MKRSLWVASSVGVVALATMVPGTRTVANTRPADLAGLQQAITSSSVVDLTVASGPCVVCAKRPTSCSKSCETTTQCNCGH